MAPCCPGLMSRHAPGIRSPAPKLGRARPPVLQQITRHPPGLAPQRQPDVGVGLWRPATQGSRQDTHQVFELQCQSRAPATGTPACQGLPGKRSSFVGLRLQSTRVSVLRLAKSELEGQSLVVESESGARLRLPGQLGTTSTLPRQQRAHDVQARHPTIHTPPRPSRRVPALPAEH